jgi:tetratricopeptide (TPR) repeat protein
MNKNKDELYFDDRKPECLFSLYKPLYADLTIRLLKGDKLTVKEKHTAYKILMLYPESATDSKISNDLIKFLKRSLKKYEYMDRIDPEKGLYYYSLFYMMMKTGRKKYASNLFSWLIKLMIDYGCYNIKVIKGPSESNYIRNILSPNPLTADKSEDVLSSSYIRLITLIWDAKELFDVLDDFDLACIPVPFLDYSEKESNTLRYNATELYEKGNYQEAIIKYNLLRISKFEVASTLNHLARAKMLLGDIDQAEFNNETAYRIRTYAKPYVVLRILWFKLSFAMLKNLDKNEKLTIISEIKKIIGTEFERVFWKVYQNLDYLKIRLNENDHQFLEALVEAINFPFFITKLDEFEIWREAVAEENE